MSSSRPPGGTATLFREEAVAELDAERRFDSRVRVVSRRAWISLSAVLLLVGAALVWAIVGRSPITVSGSGALLPANGLLMVSTPEAGTVVELPTVPDVDSSTAEDEVAAGQVLLRLRTADNGEVVVRVPVKGVLVHRAPLAIGATVTAGESVGQLVPSDAATSAVLFVNTASAQSLRPGMPVRLSPSSASPAAYGELIGTVRSVDRLPYDEADLIQLAGGNVQLAATIGAAGSLRVVVNLQPATTPSGYAWTSDDGPPFALLPATTLTGSVVVGARTPLSFLLGG